MSTSDAQQTVGVDPQRMVVIYREKLAASVDEAIMLQAALNGVVEERNNLQQKLNDRDAEVARLTTIPEQSQPAEQPAVWGQTGQGYNPEG